MTTNQQQTNEIHPIDQQMTADAQALEQTKPPHVEEPVVGDGYIDTDVEIAHEVKAAVEQPVLAPSIRSTYMALSEPKPEQIKRATKWLNSLDADSKAEALRIARPRNMVHLAKYWIWMGKPAPLDEKLTEPVVVPLAAPITHVDIEVANEPPALDIEKKNSVSPKATPWYAAGAIPSDEWIKPFPSSDLKGADGSQDGAEFADTVQHEDLDEEAMAKIERDLQSRTPADPNWTIQSFKDLLGLDSDGARRKFPPIVIAILVLILLIIVYKFFQ